MGNIIPFLTRPQTKFRRLRLATLLLGCGLTSACEGTELEQGPLAGTLSMTPAINVDGPWLLAIFLPHKPDDPDATTIQIATAGNSATATLSSGTVMTGTWAPPTLDVEGNWEEDGQTMSISLLGDFSDDGEYVAGTIWSTKFGTETTFTGTRALTDP